MGATRPAIKCPKRARWERQDTWQTLPQWALPIVFTAPISLYGHHNQAFNQAQNKQSFYS